MLHEQFTKLYRDKMEQQNNLICDRKKIYLDMNYWNYMRDCMTGKETDEKRKRIFTLLKKGIESKTILCPVSSIVFIETLKQSGAVTSLKTVETLELLSQNVTTVNSDFLPSLIFFLPFSRILGMSLPFKKCPIWTHPYFSLLPAQEIQEQLNPLLDRAVSKEEVVTNFEDFFWNVSISQLFVGIDKKSIDPPTFDFAPIFSANSQHRGDFNSFEDVLKIEREEILKLFESSAKSAYTCLCKQKFPDADASFIETTFTEARQKLLSDEYCPSYIDVHARIHALYRYEKRKYKESNDMYDFWHAAYALSGYDYFFTEHKLANVLNHRLVKLGESCDCQVESSPEQIICLLEKII